MEARRGVDNQRRPARGPEPRPGRPGAARRSDRQPDRGIILLIIGFIAKIAIVWTIGIIVLVVGIILVVLGMAGHAVGGRKHYF
jgi:Family of unknown function (DUF6131)